QQRRGQLEQTGKPDHRAQRETAEQRLREDTEQEKINRQRDGNGDGVAEPTQTQDELVRQNDEGSDIRGISYEQDGDEQSVGLLEHFLQSACPPIAALGAMAQPDRIERKQPRFDSGKEKGDNPAKCDQEPDHGSSPLPLSQSVHTVFSRSNSSIRRRLTRRTVIFKRGVSNSVPTSGTRPSWLKT